MKHFREISSTLQNDPWEKYVNSVSLHKPIMYSLVMYCSPNSLDPAICLDSQYMCFLIREPRFNIHTLTLSRKLKPKCLLCFAYQ